MNRIEFIDIIKGFAILLVVIGHFMEDSIEGNGNTLRSFNFIYTFHMPLFMFAGGYIAQLQYKNISISNIGKYILNKTRGLLIPYIMWASVFSAYFAGTLDWSTIPHRILTTFTEYRGLWFLITFFALSVAGNIGAVFLNAINTKKKLLVDSLITIILLAIFLFLNKSFHYELWRQSIAYFPFFFIGVWLKRYQFLETLSESDWFYWISFFLFFFFSSMFIEGMADIRNNLYRLLGGLFSIFVFTYLAKKCILYNIVRKLLLKLGTYSLAIYCVHWAFLRMFVHKGFLGNMFTEWWLLLIAIPISLLISFLCIWFAKLIATVPVLDFFIFGKKMKKLNIR